MAGRAERSGVSDKDRCKLTRRGVRHDPRAACDAAIFRLAAHVIEADHPAIVEKLRRASSHRTRYTHETSALARGAELTTVRDNLRHASIVTTTICLRATDWPDKSGFRSAKISRSASTKWLSSTALPSFVQGVETPASIYPAAVRDWEGSVADRRSAEQLLADEWEQTGMRKVR